MTTNKRAVLNYELIALALAILSGRIEDLTVDEYLLLGLSPEHSEIDDVLRKAENVLEMAFRLLGGNVTSPSSSTRVPAGDSHA